VLDGISNVLEALLSQSVLAGVVFRSSQPA
jgi:hypothetical protein